MKTWKCAICPLCATVMRRAGTERWTCPECERRAGIAAAPEQSKRGAPKGHPGWGGRPKGSGVVLRPCGWCQEPQSAREEMRHRARCPMRPQK